MNPYEVLGVTKNATEKEIRGRYRGLSSMYHPDKQTGDRDRFEEVKLAHDILTDPHRRKRYDTTGRIDTSPVTPERVQAFVNDTMRTVIEAARPDGSSDDPVWENIQDKVLLSIVASRAPLKNDRFKMQRKLERCQRMIERFKAKTEYDPVGIALKSERQRLEADLRINQDAMELSIEAERVFRLYSYDVGPGSEGQINPGPTGHRLLGGSRIRITSSDLDPGRH
jgi:curved DNA-binding protein CbpA